MVSFPQASPPQPCAQLSPLIFINALPWAERKHYATLNKHYFLNLMADMSTNFSLLFSYIQARRQQQSSELGLWLTVALSETYVKSCSL
jgi:hypothetical protein